MTDTGLMECTFAYSCAADGTPEALLIEEEDEGLGHEEDEQAPMLPRGGARTEAAARASPVHASAGAAFRARFRYNPAVFNVMLVANPAAESSKVPVASADLARWSPWFAGVLDTR